MKTIKIIIKNKLEVIVLEEPKIKITIKDNYFFRISNPITSEILFEIEKEEIDTIELWSWNQTVRKYTNSDIEKIFDDISYSNDCIIINLKK